MNCRWQALQLCLDAAVVVVIQIFNEFLFEMFHGLKFLQIYQLAFEQPKEIFYHSIVQTVPLATHALPDEVVYLRDGFVSFSDARVESFVNMWLEDVADLSGSDDEVKLKFPEGL